jgi:hypothetical protein
MWNMRVEIDTAGHHGNLADARLLLLNSLQERLRKMQHKKELPRLGFLAGRLADARPKARSSIAAAILLARLPFVPVAPVLLAIFGLGQIGWGEAIELSSGFGFYDGRRYGEIALDFPREVFREGLDAFRLQRVLPSGVIYLALGGDPRDEIEVRDAFRAYNLILLLATAITWAGIAREAGTSERGRWLGFSLLFLNVANLKMPFYYPVLTDTTALFLGALLLYCHLRSCDSGMLAVLVASAFTWPSLCVSGTLLFAVPRRSLPEAPSARARAIGGVVAAVVWVTIIAINHGVVAHHDLLPVTLLILLAFVVLSARGLFDNAALFDLENGRRTSIARRCAVVALILVATQWTVRGLSTAPGMTPARHLRNLVLYATSQPGLFLVAHAVYFGVLPLVLVTHWSRACRAAHRLGPGMTLYVAACLAHAVNPESRQLIDGLPAFVLLGVLALETSALPSRAGWCIAALGLAASKVWLPINQGPFGSSVDYPAQYYFMNHGPTMAPASFWLQAAIVVMLGLGFAAAGRRKAGHLAIGVIESGRT